MVLSIPDMNNFPTDKTFTGQSGPGSNGNRVAELELHYWMFSSIFRIAF